MANLDFNDLIAHNRRWTWVLLAANALLLGIIGSTIGLYLGGSWVGPAIGAGLAIVVTAFAYASASKMAISATRAVPADPKAFLQLHNLVEQIAVAAGIPKPAVYVVHDPAPNAFATGKDPSHAAVAVTTGLLEKLNRDELEGVIAHEIAHVRNLDIRVMTVAVATAGAIALITDVFWRMMFFGGARRRDNDRGGSNPLALVALIFVAVLAPIAAALLKAAISRKREALADASAVALTRYPTGLRRALEKLDADSTVVQHTSHATSHLWVESPDDRQSSGRESKFNEMFNTHPPLAERINILRGIEGLERYDGPTPDTVAELERHQARRQHIPASINAPGYQSAASTMDFGGIFGADAPSVPNLAAVESAPGAQTAAAGWYNDPSGRPNTLRYWDGARWTDHVATR